MTTGDRPGGWLATRWLTLENRCRMRNNINSIRRSAGRNNRHLWICLCQSFALTFITLLCHVTANDDSSIVVSYTTWNKSVNFTHVVVDYKSDRVYVGASNWLYQFNSSLDIETEVETGPVQDSVQCSPTDCSNHPKLATTNFNKVLVIDDKANMLLVCGSVHQGSCRRHRLGDIANYEEFISVPVAANDENSSTYAFIGPAQYFGHVSRVLYVATTNSRSGPYRDMVPAITSRSLDEGPEKLFGIIEKSFSTIARVDISFHLRDYYLVNYVYGFFSGDFSYFATVQRKSHLRALEEWGYVTRLARVCTSDAGYNTYTEITLRCLGADGTDYNLLQDAFVGPVGADLANALQIRPGSDVFVGVFVSSQDHTSKPSRNCSICVYSLSEIERRFRENIHLCYNGSVLTRNMDYIAGSINQCPEPGKAGNVLNFCNETVKLNGSVPVVALAAITYRNSRLTAVTMTTTSQHTVVFAGTDDGSLKKLVVHTSTEAVEFESVVVDQGNPIVPDLHVDPSQRFLYVASPYKISKVRIQRCHLHGNCRECLGARNPYCGWCSLEKRCTVKTSCQNGTWAFTDQSSTRWLSLESNQCIDFQSVKPNQIPYASSSMVNLVINQLPQLPLGAHYLCVFGTSDPIQARLTNTGLTCHTPLFSTRPNIPTGKDHVIVHLSVRSSETETDFISHPFVFFDCGVHRTCKDCVISAWACSWCVHENLCTHNSSHCSRRVILGESNPENSLIRGRQHCPSFSLDDEILIPNGVHTEISVGVRNLLTPLEGFQCVVEIEGAKERVFARVRDNTVVCAENIYTYQSDVGELHSTLTVLWNGDTIIDCTNITLYKCHLLGSHGGRADCSLCVAKHQKYQCSWCGDVCGYVDSCRVPAVSSCPPPRIDWIRPLSGPIQGGTLVVIEGSNLGTRLDEIEDKITIGGILCVPVEYTVSLRVVCRSGSSLGPMTAVVIVGNSAGVTRAEEKFHYKEVKISKVRPRLGPLSGGTRLYISGNELNVGSRVNIFLDDLPCRVERSLASSSQISCRTTRAPFPNYQVKQLFLHIDGANITYLNPFLYTRDPTIFRIHPMKSFSSGGREIKVFGSNFTSIQQPKMIVFGDNGVVNETFCHVHYSSLMICPSPAVQLEIQRRNHLKGHQRHALENSHFRLGFIMDDVQAVRELNRYFPSLPSVLTYVSDPWFLSFENEGVKLYKGESLVIEGENLRLASTEHEINVTIGTRRCNVTSLTMTQLVCMPPEVQPPGTDELGRRTNNQLPVVVVRVGDTLRYEVGYLRYEVTKSYEFPPEAIGGIAAGGALLMLLTLIILAILRHKSSQAEREYKRIQLQMDTLENSVRSECKQAFAELQTDMTDLNKDIQTTGVPILDRRTYMLRVFFPGSRENPAFRELKHINSSGTTTELAMAHFEQLLHTKPFLLTFIHTLEIQRSFSIRDKVNVASLMMIILLKKMDYATEVLQELLYRLINKYAGTKHPQLMLRRTESVVEKYLTNWMAVCMYNYIKEYAGSSLFLLFSAIKHQVEKGPVDARTFDARYCLSEERLLREQIDYSPVIIHLVQGEKEEKVQCRVNSCDTISQVKAKIFDTLYKNTPFSLRPSIYSVDLVWHQGRRGRTTLTDNDSTSKTINCWRRLNTLEHYGIREVAVVSLVPKTQQGSKVTGDCNTMISLSPTSPQCNEKMLGVRYWHLIRPVDGAPPDQQKDLCPKAIPEIFLTRLLSTKGTVQQFVYDFLTTVLTANEILPLPVKWLFDLFDEAATRHGISDPEVVHSWKSNSLPLRFWINLLKNPDFIFDVQKTPTVDSCLSVISQSFMDSFTTTEHRLGKDSPSSKLLFARDIPAYKQMVEKFYQDVAALPVVSAAHLKAALQSLSTACQGEVDISSALKELYTYVNRYRGQILEALECDSNGQRIFLAHRLEAVACMLAGDETVQV
ncbi:plexin-B-like [Tachypleus tridentatus]|uniref:plexin-B-like n=1 Tax=Tachypleus tridentatus TaxID=6853 RepID=UPI003FD39286